MNVIISRKGTGTPMTNFPQDTIDSHRATLNPANPRDAIDEYLIAMDEKNEIAEYFSGEFSFSISARYLIIVKYLLQL